MNKQEFLSIYPRSEGEIICPIDEVSGTLNETGFTCINGHFTNFEDLLRFEFFRKWLDGIESGYNSLDWEGIEAPPEGALEWLMNGD